MPTVFFFFKKLLLTDRLQLIFHSKITVCFEDFLHLFYKMEINKIMILLQKCFKPLVWATAYSIALYNLSEIIREIA